MYLNKNEINWVKCKKDFTYYITTYYSGEIYKIIRFEYDIISIKYNEFEHCNIDVNRNNFWEFFDHPKIVILNEYLLQI